jgi:hypothetical protein
MGNYKDEIRERFGSTRIQDMGPGKDKGKLWDIIGRYVPHPPPDRREVETPLEIYVVQNVENGECDLLSANYIKAHYEPVTTPEGGA